MWAWHITNANIVRLLRLIPCMAVWNLDGHHSSSCVCRYYASSVVIDGGGVGVGLLSADVNDFVPVLVINSLVSSDSPLSSSSGFLIRRFVTSWCWASWRLGCLQEGPAQCRHGMITTGEDGFTGSSVVEASRGTTTSRVVPALGVVNRRSSRKC